MLIWYSLKEITEELLFSSNSVCTQNEGSLGKTYLVVSKEPTSCVEASVESLGEFWVSMGFSGSMENLDSEYMFCCSPRNIINFPNPLWLIEISQ